MDERPARNASPTEKLPPHSDEAEAGVLGCVLLDNRRITEFMDVFGMEKVFYIGSNQQIFELMVDMSGRGQAIDSITLSQKLKDAGAASDISDGFYLARLAEDVPSAENWRSYADVVWEKFIARRALQMQVSAARDIMEHGGVTDELHGRMTRQVEEFIRLSERGAVKPRYLTEVSECATEVSNRLFGVAGSEEPGLELVVPFPMKVRRKETTLVTGDNGAGKSTVLSYLLIHLLNNPEEKLCVASMEMPRDVTLWIMAAQLLGMKRLPDSEQGKRRGTAVLAWLQKRVVIYDFLGITMWREMLDTFRYAADNMGCTQFLVDSVMRIGIPDDDYAQQGFCSMAFANFAMRHNAHLWHVVHENKSGGGAKANVRGSKQWSDNTCNLIRIERHQKKGEKLSELIEMLRIEKYKDNGQKSQSAIDKLQGEIDGLKKSWDSKLILQKQRWPGTQQNGSAVFYFDHECFQFRKNWNDPVKNWLAEWKVPGAGTEAGSAGSQDVNEHEA